VLAAVLGGIFAEGIDLPPGALRAVLVAGPALPPVGLERTLLKDHYEDRYGEGFRYASLVPGITRVVQAAGRLIRRPEDRGVVVLIGRRFRWRDTAALLPSWWSPVSSLDPVQDVADFFAEETS
jgi:Rad3-related DNA helicase